MAAQAREALPLLRLRVLLLLQLLLLLLVLVLLLLLQQQQMLLLLLLLQQAVHGARPAHAGAATPCIRHVMRVAVPSRPPLLPPLSVASLAFTAQAPQGAPARLTDSAACASADPGHPGGHAPPRSAGHRRTVSCSSKARETRPRV
jgi:hypothetical protein